MKYPCIALANERRQFPFALPLAAIVKLRPDGVACHLLLLRFELAGKQKETERE